MFAAISVSSLEASPFSLCPELLTSSNKRRADPSVVCLLLGDFPLGGVVAGTSQTSPKDRGGRLTQWALRRR